MASKTAARKPPAKKPTNARSASSGEFVTDAEADAKPSETVKEKRGPSLSELSARLDGFAEAIRRLASGAVVTEEQRSELFDLLEGK